MADGILQKDTFDLVSSLMYAVTTAAMQKGDASASMPEALKAHVEQCLYSL